MASATQHAARTPVAKISQLRWRRLDGLPPALAIVCDTIGQIDLGWIEKTNVLSNTLFETIAPVGWRAAAYQALEQTLGTVLPCFGYDDLFEEISAYYWEGTTDDELADERRTAHRRAVEL